MKITKNSIGNIYGWVDFNLETNLKTDFITAVFLEILRNYWNSRFVEHLWGADLKQKQYSNIKCCPDHLCTWNVASPCFFFFCRLVLINDVFLLLLIERQRDVIEESKSRRKYLQCYEYIGRHQGKTRHRFSKTCPN